MHGDNKIRLWETATARLQRAPLSISGKIREIKFSPDNRRLAIAIQSVGGDCSVEIREVTSGKMIGRPLAHRDAVTSIEFSRSGELLATACNDHTARIWKVDTGDPISDWLPHDFEARQAIFSPDANRVMTCARRGAARLWVVRTGEPLTPPIVYQRNEGDGSVSYSPDGQRLLIARGGNEAWLRELQPDVAPLEELKLRAQILSCMRFDLVADTVPLDETELDAAWQKLRAFRPKD